jgi:dihydrofolate reductase
MANMVYIACSMDGFIAKIDGNIDWLLEIPNESNNDYGFGEFMERVDGIIMGRNTFEKVLEIQPNEWRYSKTVFVLSNTLKNIPERLKSKVEIINGDLTIILEELKERNINNLYVDGGKTIQSFLKHDLIDEMIITTIPIILGNGMPLFGVLNKEIKFYIEKTEYIDRNIAMNYYKRIRT